MLAILLSSSTMPLPGKRASDALKCFDPSLLPSSDGRRIRFTTYAFGFNFDCRCGPCKMMEPKYVEFSEVSRTQVQHVCALLEPAFQHLTHRPLSNVACR